MRAAFVDCFRISIMMSHCYVYWLVLVFFLMDLPLMASEESSNIAAQSLKCYRSDAIEEATKLAEQALQADPSCAEAHYVKALIAYYKRKEKFKAQNEFNKAISLKPSLTEAYIDRADLEWSLKDEEKALNDISKAIELSPNNSQYPYIRGKRYFEKGEFAKSIADFTSAIKIDPQNAAAYDSRGNAQRALKKYDEALSDHAHAIAIKPSPEFICDSGWDYYEMGKRKDATTVFEQALAADPKFKLAYKGLGYVLYQDKEYEKALKNLSIWLNENPDDKQECLKKEALCYYELGQYEKSIADYDSVLKENPKDEEAYNCRGLALSDSNQYRKSIVDFDKAISISMNAAYFNNRGYAHYYLREYDLALEDFNSAIALNSQLVIALKGRGLCYATMNLYDKALADFDACLKLEPNRKDIMRDKANMLAAIGKDRESLESLNQLLKLDPKDASVYVLIARRETELRQLQQAVLDCDKAISMLDASQGASTWTDVKIDAVEAKAAALIFLGENDRGSAELKKILSLDREKYPNASWQRADWTNELWHYCATADEHSAEYLKVWGGKEKHSPSCTPAQLWALACPALLTKRNKLDHSILWLTPETPESVFHKNKPLSKWWIAVFEAKGGDSQWWDINSREDLLKQLEWIDSGGHRAEFDAAARMVNNPRFPELIAQMKNPAERKIAEERTAFVRQHSRLLKGKSLIGWDYCRYINICRTGVLCSYLTEQEAWNKIMPVARLLQSTFTSWNELGTNYLVGRKFWQPNQEAEKDFERNYDFLINDPSSPWVKIPWNTNLSEKPQGTPSKAMTKVNSSPAVRKK